MAAGSESELFACAECGHRTGKWMGFCAQCRAQGSLNRVQNSPAAVATALGTVATLENSRLTTGIGEMDRTLGGGLVAGAAIVVGGEPGVGKSTLLLQVAASIVAGGSRALVVSAEESPGQVAIRAGRLTGSYDEVQVMSTNDVDEVVAAAESLRPAVLIVDSIQSIATRDADGPAGGVGQVRECGARLVKFAKRSGIPVVMIGHVTKEGTLAGPRVLEHMVDVVLHLEGDAHRGLRFVRGLKNRFGPTPALGFFEMGEQGLSEVADPGRVLIDRRNREAPGAVLFPAIEGRRPVVVEVQALVAATRSTQPRRSVKGIEAARLHQVLAVLDRHADLSVASSDVYVAVVGGVRIREPAADLAVALAVASSATGRPIPATAAWGEVGLTGEIRGVAGDDIRRAEVRRLGVTRLVSPVDGDTRLVEALAATRIPASVGFPRLALTH